MPGYRGRRQGGARAGAVGKSYPQRTDLNTAGGKAPIMQPTGGQYGSGVAAADAQRAVPMGTPQLPAGGSPPAFTGRPDTMPPAGSLGDLFADSTNPDEHVMNGAALGPGLGPAAMGINPDAALRKDDLAAMAVYLPMMQEIAARPGTSPQVRNWVRGLLGAS